MSHARQANSLTNSIASLFFTMRKHNKTALLFSVLSFLILYNQIRCMLLLSHERPTHQRRRTDLSSHTSPSFTLPPQTDTTDDYHKLPLCQSHEEMVESYAWHRIYLKEAPYISKTVHLRCHEEDYYHQKPFPTFVWRPTNCRLLGWNATRFLQLMTNQTVSIIGDSLNWEMYSSLLQLLRQRVHQTDQHKSKDQEVNHVQTIDAQRYQWKFVFRNDKWLEHVGDSIQNDFPNILILNRGAHYQDDTTLANHLKSNLRHVLKEWYSKCTEQFGAHQCHLFWRTTSAGHPNCQDFEEPFDDMHSMIHNMTFYEVTNTTHYHWYDFERQNQIALETLNEALDDVPFHVIPGYEITVGRPDAHRSHQGDCLHNCYPGKMDTYNQVLHHYLNVL